MDRGELKKIVWEKIPNEDEVKERDSLKFYPSTTVIINDVHEHLKVGRSEIIEILNEFEKEGKLMRKFGNAPRCWAKKLEETEVL